MFKIELDSEIATKLRNSINKEQDISLQIIYNKKNAWNTICSILDRIDDLVIYLNSLELNCGKYNHCAFDFFEFINASGVLIECIETLAKIYKVNFNNQKTNIFRNKYINEEVRKVYLKENKLHDKENDYQYFKYLRSLSSIHPVETNRHLIYMSDDLEVSPYAVWSDGFIHDKSKGELTILAYSEVEEYKYVYVKIEEVFEFVNYKYNNINQIIYKIKRYNKDIINNLKQRKIKKEDDFVNYNLYLNELIKESEERCPRLADDIKEAKEIINISMTKKENIIKYSLYCNALKYSIKYIHKCLQNMNFSFSSNKSKLFFELLNPSKTYTDLNYHYQLEKICYLKGEYGDADFGKSMFKIMLPLFSKYISISSDDIDNQIFDMELYVLSRVALYFNNLNNKSLINSIIPQNSNFRI